MCFIIPVARRRRRLYLARRAPFFRAVFPELMVSISVIDEAALDGTVQGDTG